MRKYFNLYRLASLIIILFFFGHTLGGMVFHKSVGPEEDSIRESMKKVHFMFKGSDCTYFGFHQGFGLMFSIFLLFSAFLSWQLGKPNAPKEMAQISWALFLSYIGIGILSWEYFFAGPVITSGILVILFGYKSLRWDSAHSSRSA